MVERLNSLWVGERLGYVERLCLASAVSVGHRFTVYSYTPSDLQFPKEVEVQDARQIMAEEIFLSHSLVRFQSHRIFSAMLLVEKLGLLGGYGLLFS